MESIPLIPCLVGNVLKLTSWSPCTGSAMCVIRFILPKRARRSSLELMCDTVQPTTRMARMTKFFCPCSYSWSEEDGKDREISAECSFCVANGGDYKKSPYWYEPERAPLPPPPWRAEEVDLATGSTDGTIIPFPTTAKARTAASARGRDRKAKKKKASAAAGK